MKRPHHLAILTLITCSSLVSCGDPKTPEIRLSPPESHLAPGTEAVDAQRAAALIRDDLSIQIVDFRDEAAFRTGHIQSALHANYFATDSTPERLRALNPSLPILVYCELGELSRQATAQVAELGFTRIYWLEGGLRTWRQQGLPLTDPY